MYADEKIMLPNQNERSIQYWGDEFRWDLLTCYENDTHYIWNGFMQYWENESTRKFHRWMDKYDTQMITKIKASLGNIARLTGAYESLPF